MDWIKRNLYFVIGGVVALLLMGLTGFYFYSKLQLNNEIMQKLDEQYAELQRLSGEKPHPGYGQVNNIQAARDQEREVRAVLKKVRAHFQPIPAIPDAPKVTSQAFSASLRRTIDQLQKQATNESVMLPPNYSFSFEAQKPRVTFAPGSLEPLAVQLGEVKAICAILFAAKINSLDNLRRERVSADDATGPQTDYLEQKSVTNDLAVLTPYEVTLRCFSSELGALLAGFGSSPYGFMVKSINVESADSGAPFEGMNPEMAMPGYAPAGMPAPRMEAETMARRYGAEMPGGRFGAAPVGGGGAEMSRYGGEMPGGGAVYGGIPLRPLGSQPTAPPVYQNYGYAAAAPAAQRGGLQTVLDEKQLKVTFTLETIKLLPPKKDGAARAVTPNPEMPVNPPAP